MKLSKKIMRFFIILIFTVNLNMLFSYDVNPNATKVIGRWYNYTNDGGIIFFVFRQNDTFQFIRFTKKAIKVWDYKGEFIVLGTTLAFRFYDGSRESWTIVKFDNYTDAGITTKRMTVIDKKGKRIILFKAKDSEFKNIR